MYYNLRLRRGGARIDAVRDGRHAAAGNWLEGPAAAIADDLTRFLRAGITYPIIRIYADDPVDLFAQLRIVDEEIRPAVSAAALAS
jgi:hypothetical protein